MRSGFRKLRSGCVNLVEEAQIDVAPGKLWMRGRACCDIPVALSLVWISGQFSASASKLVCLLSRLTAPSTINFTSD
jgi:hypothetical protein